MKKHIINLISLITDDLRVLQSNSKTKGRVGKHGKHRVKYAVIQKHKGTNAILK